MTNAEPTFPTGRSAYVPGNARTHEATPQSDPDLFSTEDIRAEMAYLEKLDKRHGAHFLRAQARVELAIAIAKREAKR